jgi:peptidoglycan/xylan/chitin deacetylase (PgdA/CDA1 family)
LKKAEFLSYAVFAWSFMLFVLLAMALPFLSGSGTVHTQAPVVEKEPEADNTPPPSASGPDILLFDENMSLAYPLDNRPVYDRYTVAERRNKGIPTRLPATTPYYGEKVVYLTFDDGPDFENTPAVLTILKASNIKATFFVVGSEAEKMPDLLRQIFLQGHAIGNHTYNHIYRELYRSPSSYTEQLHRTDEIIKNIIGVRPHISRAPGGSAGSFTKRYWEALHTEGYMEVGWNVSSADASNAKADQLVDNIVYQMDNNYLWSHAIVLMHDGRGHAETVKALPEIGIAHV